MKAIVISYDHYNGLGLIRSLGEQKIDVYLILVTVSNNTYIHLSKYITKTVKIDDEKHILKAIYEIANDSKEIYYVFPCTDFSAMILDKNIGKFKENIVIPNMNGCLFKMQDKEYAKCIASKIGLVVPQSVKVTLDSCNKIDWNKFPAIIKPLVSIKGKKSDIVIVNNTVELENQMDNFRKMNYDSVLVEEYIYGENEYMLEVLGCSSKDKVDIAGYIHKKREFPMLRGSTSYAHITNYNECVTRNQIEQFILETKYEGIFDVEFKCANNVAYFIECNFRNGAPSYICSLLNRNIPITWIDYMGGNVNYLLKNEIDEIDFMSEQMDILNLLKGEVTVLTWIRNYINSKHIFWKWNDFKPSMKYYMIMLSELFKKLRR